MNHYNEAVMMAYQLGIWERIPDGGAHERKTRLLERWRSAGPFRLRAAPRSEER